MSVSLRVSFSAKTIILLGGPPPPTAGPTSQKKWPGPKAANHRGDPSRRAGHPPLGHHCLALESRAQHKKEKTNKNFLPASRRRDYTQCTVTTLLRDDLVVEDGRNNNACAGEGDAESEDSSDGLHLAVWD